MSITTYVYFANKEILIPNEALEGSYHQGQCYDSVRFWQDQIDNPFEVLSDDELREAIAEYGTDGTAEMDRDELEMYALWLVSGDYHDGLYE